MEGNAQVNRSQRGAIPALHVALPRATDTRLPYHLLTMLLISDVFACVINNVYLEKSMCIIVFDLAMNFKAKDSIFFFFLSFFKKFSKK